MALITPTRKGFGPFCVGLGHQFVGDAGLTDARLAGQHHNPPLAGHCVIQSVGQNDQLFLSAYEVRFRKYFTSQNDAPPCLVGCILQRMLALLPNLVAGKSVGT